jgi:hypothetical protein
VQKDTEDEIEKSISAMKNDIKDMSAGQEELQYISDIEDKVNVVNINLKNDLSAMETKLNAGKAVFEGNDM